MDKRKPDFKGAAIVLVVWLLALWIYGLAGESDRVSSGDLTGEVNRAEVMAWAR